MSKPSPSSTIMRLFEVQTKPGTAAALLDKFATTSAGVVQNEPGNQGYYFGHGVAQDDGLVVFASFWQNLEAVQARFGANWQEAFLPEGYEDLIESCCVRHIDIGAGWHVQALV